MNIADVRTQHTEHGHIGEFRLAWRTEFFQVRIAGSDSPLRYFSSAKDAEIAAWREMNRIEQTAMVRGGEKLQAISRADALFNLPSTIKQRGKTRRIAVERRGGAA